MKGDGGNFRLMSNVTDMSKTRLVIDAGTYVAHNASGGGGEVAATTKIGSLSGTATDATLGGSQSTWSIGHLNENSVFSGLLKASRINKVGTGKLTLKTAGHTAPIYITGGTLELQGSASTAMTTGIITVQNGGQLLGTAMASAVTVQRGSVITGGLEASSSGSLRVNGALTLQAGSTVKVRLGQSVGNTTIAAKAAIRHSGDTILVSVPAGRILSVDDELTVFASGFTSATGNFFVKCETEDGSAYEFDSSTLLTDGKLRVTSVASGIAATPTPDTLVDVFDADGAKLRSAVPCRHALDGLRRGIYIVGGQKISKK